MSLDGQAPKSMIPRVSHYRSSEFDATRYAKAQALTRIATINTPKRGQNAKYHILFYETSQDPKIVLLTVHS